MSTKKIGITETKCNELDRTKLNWIGVELKSINRITMECEKTQIE